MKTSEVLKEVFSEIINDLRSNYEQEYIVVIFTNGFNLSGIWHNKTFKTYTLTHYQKVYKVNGKKCKN